MNNLCVKKSFEILKAERAVIKAAIAYRLEDRKIYPQFKVKRFEKLIKNFHRSVDSLNKLKESRHDK